MPTLTMPQYPVRGMPEDTKEAGFRVDFRPTDFDKLIETKGYLLSWTRACQCPCRPVSELTENSDPNCALCQGSGWLYYGRSEGVEPDWATIGEVTAVQKALIARDDAMVIRGVVSGAQQEYDPWNQVGRWRGGSVMCTVRPENKIAYYDKIITLDTEIVFSEVVEAGSPDDSLRLRYLATGINHIRSVERIFVADVDFVLDVGRVKWNPSSAPVVKTRLAVHYLCHPTWLVFQHPHVVRTTSVKYKTPTPKTPLGDPRALPIQAMMRYDFLLENED